MGFQARREADCCRCGERIGVGELIKWQRHSGKTWHSKCDAMPMLMPDDGAKARIKGDGGGQPTPEPKENGDAMDAEIVGAGEGAEEKVKEQEAGEGDDQAKQTPKPEDKPEDAKGDKDAPKPQRSALEAELEKFVQSVKDAQANGAVNEKAVRAIAKEEAEKAGIQRIELKRYKEDGEAEIVKLGKVHKSFAKLLKLASSRNVDGFHPNIYLYGPAGTGKTTAARQVAEAMGLGFGYVSLSPQSPASLLTGFMHAGGQYTPSLMFPLYTGVDGKAGLCLIDEMDNGSAATYTAQNSMLANGHASFPHGMFPRHPDFICMAAGNTLGLGGDIHYPERRRLDGATRDRFAFFCWEEDKALTASVIHGILGKEDGDEFLKWVWLTADKILARKPEMVITPRAYIDGAAMLKNGFSKKDITDMIITRGVPVDGN